MTTASLTRSPEANTQLLRSWNSVSTNVRAKEITSEIVRIFRRAMNAGSFRKTAAARAKCSLGTIDNWTANKRAIDLEHLLNVCDGPEGVDCFDAFWKQVPEETRERWFARQVLERRIAEAEAEVKRVRSEARDQQLRMELKRQ